MSLYKRARESGRYTDAGAARIGTKRRTRGTWAKCVVVRSGIMIRGSHIPCECLKHCFFFFLHIIHLYTMKKKKHIIKTFYEVTRSLFFFYTRSHRRRRRDSCYNLIDELFKVYIRIEEKKRKSLFTRSDKSGPRLREIDDFFARHESLYIYKTSKSRWDWQRKRF